MFPFTDLFELGFGLGAGLAAVAAPITAAVVLFDHALDRRARGKRAARRRVPSVSGNTQELPRITEGDKIISWGKDVQNTDTKTDDDLGPVQEPGR